MSATGTDLIHRGELFLASAGMHNTAETWEWLMDAVLDGTIDLDNLPTDPATHGSIIDLFDAWADRPDALPELAAQAGTSTVLTSATTP
jgi:threonine dehydrogenase-like Zn-dependent dehydrogenase